MPACPYLDCAHPALPAGEESCPVCRRLLKPCPKCSETNRAFSNFCRSCASPQPDPPGEWSAYKGGPQRLGLNRTRQAGPLGHGRIHEVLEMQLGDRCRSLLTWDRHLIAVSQNGIVETADVVSTVPLARLHADGPVSCEPCVSRGTLFLGAPGRVAAYALGGLALRPASLEPRWEVRLPATPIQALTAFEDRLYVTINHSDQTREILVLEDVHRRQPTGPRTIFSARRLSWIAADPALRRLVFLSEEEGEIWVHIVEPSRGESTAVASRRIPQAPHPFADHVPIAVLGDKLFGVFGEADRLCRIDCREGSFDQGLRNDTKTFSMSSPRDGIHVDNAGVFFLGTGTSDSLNPMERVKGTPVIVGDWAAAIALQDGRIRVYDLHNPPRHEVLRLSREPDEVSALASFRTCLAAGNARGTIKVFELADSPPR